MQLSMRTDYALRALATLAGNYGQRRPVSIPELARRNNVPKRFLEHIMLDLKQRGWVESLIGKKGGYTLSQPPEQITMGAVIRHFDGYLAPLACVSVTGYRCCSQEATCRFRRVMWKARNAVARLMDETTLADILATPPLADYEFPASNVAPLEASKELATQHGPKLSSVASS
jgi:Rrf2 family protein